MRQYVTLVGQPSWPTRGEEKIPSHVLVSALRACNCKLANFSAAADIYMYVSSKRLIDIARRERNTLTSICNSSGPFRTACRGQATIRCLRGCHQMRMLHQVSQHFHTQSRHAGLQHFHGIVTIQEIFTRPANAVHNMSSRHIE